MSFSREIVDSYEAAYYFMQGAKIASVRTRSVRPKARHRLGFRTMWVVSMSDIPAEAMKAWREGSAAGSLRTFSDARRRLKRKISEYLEAKQ